MKRVQLSIVLLGFTITIASMFMFSVENNAFALEYKNYTSDRYKMQFDYPSDWTVTEKTSRFDSGADIKIESPTFSQGSFNIVYADEDLLTEFRSSDIQTATYNLLESETQGEYEVRIIEKPSFLTIDNQKTGTYLVTLQEKYEKYPIKLAHQTWITFVGDRGYLIGTTGSTESFDNPENMEIRDHLIKSIKFLDAKPPSVSNSTSRFD